MPTPAEDASTTVDSAPPGAPLAAANGSGDPFRVFGIVGFVLSLFAVLNFAGLVVSIIALVRSKRAGFRNRFAFAGVVIGGLGVLVTIVLIAVVVGGLANAAQTCAQLGDGVHVVGSATYTCAPGSFYVSYSR